MTVAIRAHVIGFKWPHPPPRRKDAGLRLCFPLKHFRDPCSRLLSVGPRPINMIGAPLSTYLMRVPIPALCIEKFVAQRCDDCRNH